MRNNIWRAVGNLSILIHVHDQNDPPEIVAPADGMFLVRPHALQFVGTPL